MKHIGFTGTRAGMTLPQKETFTRLLRASLPCTLHHGDCVGADTDAHCLARELGARVIVHPPVKSDLRSFCESDELREPKTYFARNRDIVSESVSLIATPATSFETAGGTWYTIDYAKKAGKPAKIISPTGEVL